MKKLISSVLVLTLSFCTLGGTTCFAVGSETKSKEVKTEQVVDQKVDTVATTKDLNDIKDQIQQIAEQIEAQSETKNGSEKSKCIFNKLLKVTMGIAKFAGAGVVLGASLYAFRANFPQLESSIDKNFKNRFITLYPELSAYLNKKLNLGWFETLNGDVSSMAKSGAIFGLAVELLSLNMPRALADLYATVGLLAINAGPISELYISFQEPPKYM